MSALAVIAAIVAVAATFLTITRTNAVHALLYLVVSLLAVAVAFVAAGALFAAALEVIVYAGAIMVLFVFVAIMLNRGKDAAAEEKRWLPARAWAGPAVLGAVLLVEVAALLARGGSPGAGTVVDAKAVGTALYGPYIVAVELVGLLLLGGLVGAYYLGRHADEEDAARARRAPDGAHRALRSGEAGAASSEKTEARP